jgi:Fe-S-cluster containining protein
MTLKSLKKKQKEIRSVLKKLRRTKPKDLDDQFHALHHQAFSEIDCLQCANCCSTTSPIFLQSDITRLAKTLKMKTSEFISTYLKMDEEGDYVLLNSPCKEYPHTDRKRMYQITNITYKNSLMCPAVSRIMSSIMEIYS